MAKQNKLQVGSTYSFGIGWQSTAITYAGIETVKEEKSAVAINLLLQYLFAQQFLFSLSWSATSNQPCVSFSWQFKRIRTGAGASYHPSLGPSPFASLVFQKNSGEDTSK